MERIELLSEEEWVIALLAGGGKWLSDTASGRIEKVEQVKVGETPDGQPIFQAQGLIGSSTGKALDFKSALPVIYREGDRTQAGHRATPAGRRAALTPHRHSSRRSSALPRSSCSMVALATERARVSRLIRAWTSRCDLLVRRATSATRRLRSPRSRSRVA